MRAFPIIWFGSIGLVYLSAAVWNMCRSRIGWVIFDVVFASVMVGLALYHYRAAKHA